MKRVRKIAIIIVFSYYGSKKSIIGSIFDLKSIVDYCITTGYDEIRALTDFDSEMLNSGEFRIRRSMYENISRSIDMTINYSNLGSIRELFSNLTPDERRFIYYSGHCRNNMIILPSYGQMHMRDLTMMAICNASSAFFMIDCCQCEGAEILYRVDVEDIISMSMLHNCESHIDYKYTLRDIRNEEYTRCKIISVSSSNKGNNSYSTEHGSVFTQVMLKLLKQYRDANIALTSFIIDLNREMQYYSQKHITQPSVNVSRTTIINIFSWIYTCYETINVSIDPIRQIISIEC